MAYAFESTIVSSLDGQRSIALTKFEGVHPIQNRDAVGFYFTVRARAFSGDSRVAVLFSGTSLMSTPEYFGLPDFKDRDANFVQFALAAIGDYSDSTGYPPYTPSGVGAAQIEAFSGRFQEWKRRDTTSDERALGYIKARLYWTWKYNVPRTQFTSHDILRLGLEITDIHRLSLLEEDRLWKTHSKSAFGITLEPAPELLREQKVLLDTPAPATPASVAAEPPTAPAPAPVELPKALRRPGKRPKRRRGTDNDSTAIVFVDEARLADLRKLAPADYDLRKLIEICGELNTSFRSQCYIAVAALTRALLDHVPPIFGVDSFAKVANNYGGGGRSFTESMQHLDNSARKIADAHLHLRIRKRESLPTRTQVNFAADVDVLLAEVVRILS